MTQSSVPAGLLRRVSFPRSGVGHNLNPGMGRPEWAKPIGPDHLPAAPAPHFASLMRAGASRVAAEVRPRASAGRQWPAQLSGSIDEVHRFNQRPERKRPAATLGGERQRFTLIAPPSKIPLVLRGIRNKAFGESLALIPAAAL